jgi:outer membrane protein assembly factor BamB
VIANDGTIYFGSDDGYLYALKSDGTQQWRFQTGGPVASVPAIGADGSVYFGSDDGQVRAVTSAGTLRWAHAAGGAARSSPVLGQNGLVYVGSDDGYLYALDPVTGSLVWRRSLGGPVRSSPALGAYGSTVYVGSDAGKLWALNGGTGTVNWTYSTGGSVRSSPAIGPDGTIYFASYDHVVYAVRDHGAAASLLWTQETGGNVESSPALAGDGTLYVGSDDAVLYALDSTPAAPARVKWTYHSGGALTGSPVVTSQGLVLAPSLDHKLSLLSSSGALQWSFDLGASLWSSPAVVSDGTVLIGSDANELVKVGTPLISSSMVLSVSPHVIEDATTLPHVTATFTVNALPAPNPDCPTCRLLAFVEFFVVQQGTGLVVGRFFSPAAEVTAPGPITAEASWDGQIGDPAPAPDDTYIIGGYPSLVAQRPLPLEDVDFVCGNGFPSFDFGLTRDIHPVVRFCRFQGCPHASPVIQRGTEFVCSLLHGADLGQPFVFDSGGTSFQGLIFGDAQPGLVLQPGLLQSGNGPSLVVQNVQSGFTSPTFAGGPFAGNEDLSAILGPSIPAQASPTSPSCSTAPFFGFSSTVTPVSYNGLYQDQSSQPRLGYLGPLFVPGPGFSVHGKIFAPIPLPTPIATQYSEFAERCDIMAPPNCSVPGDVCARKQFLPPADASGAPLAGDYFVNMVTEGTRDVCATGSGCVAAGVTAPDALCAPRLVPRTLGIADPSGTNFIVPNVGVDVESALVTSAFSGKFSVTASTVDTADGVSGRVYHFGRSSFVGGFNTEPSKLYLMETAFDGNGRLGTPRYFGGCTGGCNDSTTFDQVSWVDNSSDAVEILSEQRAVITNTGSVERIDGIGPNHEPMWVMMYGGRWPKSFLSGTAKFIFPTLTSEVVQDQAEGVQLRTAPNPWGPWDSPATVYTLFSATTPGYCQIAHWDGSFPDDVTCANGYQNLALDQLSPTNHESGAEYGIGILKLFTATTSDGSWVYWTMSTWNPYRVHIMRTFVSLGGSVWTAESDPTAEFAFIRSQINKRLPIIRH